MLFQRYQTRVDRLRDEGEGPEEADAIAKDELRDDVLGGRVLGGFVGTAPLAAEMRAFIESCVDAQLFDVSASPRSAGSRATASSPARR